MILFLDFDGVMHPNNRPGTLFMWVPRLAAWLDAWPEVDVVISSSWRVHHSQEEMVEMLGPVIGSRIAGCTPWTAQQRDDNGHPPAGTSALTHERQVEVEAGMAASWDPGRAWVALDDMPYLFESDCGRLVVCAGQQGLSRENLQELSGHAKRAGLIRSQRCGPVAGGGAHVPRAEALDRSSAAGSLHPVPVRWSGRVDVVHVERRARGDPPLRLSPAIRNLIQTRALRALASECVSPAQEAFERARIAAASEWPPL